MPPIPSTVRSPNIIIVETARRLLLHQHRGAEDCRQLPAAMQHGAQSSALILAETLRAKGYHTAQAACYLLDEQDNPPLSTRGFDSAYNVFCYWPAEAAPISARTADNAGDDVGANAGADPYGICAGRVGEMNSKVVAQVVRYAAASLENGRPFFVVCGIETAAGSREHARQVNRLRQQLQQLGVTHNTLLIYTSRATVRPELM